ncbi:MAG: LCP family protein [Coriobacteriia bacterium]|nr:LCP family protein [Coriobacteriia bacterium]
MDDRTPRPRRSERHAKPSRSRAPRPINRLEPASTTRETPEEARRRRRRSSKIVTPEVRRRKRGRVAIIVGVIFLAVVVAGGVAAFTYLRGLESKIRPLSMMDTEFAKQLDQDVPPPGEPFYLLLMGDDRRPGESRARSDTLIVARIDPKQRKVQMVSILRDTRVKIPGYGMNKINAAPQMGGPELALKTVREMTGLPVSRYLTVDFTGFRYIVDAMGGVWIDVPEKVDGRPNKKNNSKWELENRIIPKGLHKLNGIQALTFVRERHQFADQDYSRVKNQQLFLKALAKQALQMSSVFRAPQIIGAISDHLRTNMSLTELANLVSQFKSMNEADFETTTLPSYPKFIDGLSYVIADEVEADALFARMRKGQPLVPKGAVSKTPTNTVDPSKITVSIRNGAGVSGLAKQATTFFTSKKFKIGETGNTNQFVYGKTLIVFTAATENKAAAVANALGYGQVIRANGMYTFKGDILVIIGKDWRDPAASAVRR